MIKNKSIFVQRSIVLAVLLGAIAAYFINPRVNEMAGRIFQMFASGDFEVVRDFVSSFGPLAMMVSFFLMILTLVFPPLPAFMVTFANASFFGWWQGALLSWTSAMVGAAICFYLARLFGRGFVVKVATNTGLRQVDAFFQRYGKQSILIARLLPFISFGVVSYAGGLTPMAFVPYMVATGIGQTPSTLIYSYVGGMLTGGARMLVSGLLILFALSILASVLSGMFRNKSTESKGAPKRENNQ